MLSEVETSRLRARFPIFREKVYLNTCSQGALSDVVEAAMQDYLRSWHAGGSPWELWVEKYEQARSAFAALINARPEEVAVVASASAGINAVASALDYGQRRKVVMGEFEFPTMGHVWLAQQARGARVEFLEATREVLPVEAYAGAVDADTLIVPLTRVCFRNGHRSDPAAIAGIAHAAGALVFLDDYQDCGTRPIDVKAFDVDFYVAGTLKYLLSPPGLAFLYAKPEHVARLIPTISGWFAQANPFAFDVRLFDPAPTARRFEAGTPPIPSIYGALAAFGLLGEIALENVAQHVEHLSQALLQGARALGIRAKTPADSVGPLVVLQADDAAAVVTRLAERNIVTSSRHDGLRISFHIYNTLDDVHAVLRVLEENLALMVRNCDPA